MGFCQGVLQKIQKILVKYEQIHEKSKNKENVHIYQMRLLQFFLGSATIKWQRKKWRLSRHLCLGNRFRIGKENLNFMKKTILRMISLLLCGLLLGGMLLSCGKDEEGDAVTDTQASADVQGTAAAESSGEENLDEQTKYRPEQVDMGGYELRMYSCADQARWFVYQESLVGDPVNRAIYNRQQFMEQYFNIKISIENVYPSKDLMSDLDKNFTNGQDFADILFIKSEEALRYAASKGQIMQLNNKEGFHLDASYWDQRIQTELNINGKLFLLEGDFSVYDELRTDGILYNRAMYKSLGHEDKYGDLPTIVQEGGWTFELLQTLVKDGSVDVNKDGLDKDDTVGFFTNAAAPYCYFLASLIRSLEGYTFSMDILILKYCSMNC